jgi:hypothetical protein
VGCSRSGFGVRSGWGEGEQNGDCDQGQDGKDEDAALRVGGSAAEEWLADGVGSDEVELDHGSAIGYSVEEGLCPIPRGVEADGPPEGSEFAEFDGEDDHVHLRVNDPHKVAV